MLLFHHGHGLTDGVREFADALRAVGHDVHVPDLYDGRVFDDLREGLAYARQVGFDAIQERGVATADGLPNGLVYAGFSLGVMAAQQLAQTRPGAKGALLFHSCLPPAELGGPWPPGVRVQIHGMDADPYFADEGDLDAARVLVQETADAELFLYEGDQHLFADRSLPAFREVPAALLTERVVRFLDGIR
ncbi:dienelactone hydrolase [Cellulomonas aerilata]|uniref:Dienelactone hydrolase n=1 Tax=Cellulomonas aerilata TaxID=515326 RepID=A0A512DFS0_9CELL|nr:dienelactone hydrolase [Cellulomonas aerilata]